MSEDWSRELPAWAEEIRDGRTRRLWTQKALAKELWEAADGGARAQLPARSSMIRQIREHERGINRPGPLYAELYRRVWARHPNPADEVGHDGSASEAMCADPLTLAWTVGRLNQRVDRRTLLQLAAVASAGSALDPAQRLARALSWQHRPDESTVAELEDRSKGFHRLEEHFPAKALYPSLLSHLGDVSALLENGPPKNLRKRLAVTAGEGAVLAAWMAWELGDFQRAFRTAKTAKIASQEGGDPAIEACMLGYRTYMTGGDHQRGVRLSRDAIELLGDADPGTLAWFLARHAEEAALLGDQRTALESARRATDAYGEADMARRPWTCFLDPSRFASMTLAVYSRLGREDDALRAVDEIEMNLGPGTETKKLCVVKADMAMARLRLGDVTEAVAFARDAMHASADMHSPLGWDRLDGVFVELADSRSAVAGEFRQEFAAIRPKPIQPSLL